MCGGVISGLHNDWEAHANERSFVPGKETPSCALACSILMTAIFWGLSLSWAWRDTKMKGVTVDIACSGSAYMAVLCCWITSIYWLYLTTQYSCFTLLSAKILLVNLMQGVSLLLEPLTWWKIQLQHKKLENQGASDKRQTQVKPGSVKGQSRGEETLGQWTRIN